MPYLTHFFAGGSLLAEFVNSVDAERAGQLIAGYDLNRFTKVFADGEIMATCFCLFENDLNVSRTSRKLYMHRNTLIYRLKKLTKITGLDVCRFPDAVTFIILYTCACRGEVEL